MILRELQLCACTVGQFLPRLLGVSFEARFSRTGRNCIPSMSCYCAVSTGVVRQISQDSTSGRCTTLPLKLILRAVWNGTMHGFAIRAIVRFQEQGCLSPLPCPINTALCTVCVQQFSTCVPVPLSLLRRVYSSAAHTCKQYLVPVGTTSCQISAHPRSI